jgi:hypothetical protein
LTINQRRKELVKKIEAYDENSQSRCVVAFAQFQSMAGQRRFIKAAKMGWFRKTFQASKYEGRK